MRSVILAPFLVMFVCAASAEVKKSSRNLEPLTKRSGSTASASSGNTGMSIATPAKEAVQNTVTKVTFSGPKNGWGFVMAASPYYTPQGKNCGKLPGGTLFKYTDVKESSRNAMLVCSVKLGESWEGPILLDCTDVAAYEGSPETLAPATVKNLGVYYTLNGRVADRKEELLDAKLAKNPHYEAAKQAQKAYQDSITKAAAMEKQMNTLTGPSKAKADEALRALKYEQVRIKAAADAAALAYKTWKESHPVDPGVLAADPQLMALEKERQAAKAAVASLLPPA